MSGNENIASHEDDAHSSAVAMHLDRQRIAGFVGLTLFATLGLVLEALLGWKSPAYLGDELTRELLRLAHAHGVGLALLSLVHVSAAGRRVIGERAQYRFIGGLIIAAQFLMPFGFGLSAIAHPEGDPGPAIALAPLGGLCLVVALVFTCYRLIRTRPSQSDDAMHR